MLFSIWFHEYISKKIAQKIGDRGAYDRDRIAEHFQIGIGIAIAISISAEDRDRDRDLNFGDRGNALLIL